MAMLAAVAVATLIPAGWQVRTGLHWLVEHFLAYFAVTAIFCLAGQRPVVVAALLIPLSVVLEAMQGLTPDRVPDVPTALAGASAIIAAALVVQGLQRVLQLREYNKRQN